MSGETTYTYQVFRQDELINIFQSLWPDFVLVGNILTDPPQIVGIYKRFLRHYNVSLDKVDMQLFPTTYPVHDGHEFYAINIYQFINRFAPVLQIPDFCLTDVLMPSAKRAKRILSAMANFLLFTTSTKREDFVQEVNERQEKNREQHEWRLKEIERLTKLQNQYLMQREENEMFENKVEQEYARHLERFKELREIKKTVQKELTRKNEALAELEVAVQEAMNKSKKLSQEEEEYKKLIVKSPEGVEAEKKQAQDDLQRAFEKERRILMNEADYNQQDMVLDELCEELPYISRVRDQVNASRKTKKQLNRLRVESSNMRGKVDEKVNALQSLTNMSLEREKTIQVARIRLANEKKAYTEELNLLDGALTEKNNTLTKMSQKLEKVNDQIKYAEKHLKELKKREARALKKVEHEKQSCVAEADRFDAEVVKIALSYSKQKGKFHHLPIKPN